MSLMMDLLPLELLCEILALAGWEEKEDELAIRSTCRAFWALTDGTFLARHSADCLVRQPMKRLIFHEVYTFYQDDDLDTFVGFGEWGINYRIEPCFPNPVDLERDQQLRAEYISCPNNLSRWPHMRKIIFRRYFLLDKPWPDNWAYF